MDSLRDSLAAQLSGLEALPGLHLKGRLLADENFRDIIGIQVALDAYHASPGAEAAPVLDGFSGDQRHSYRNPGGRAAVGYSVVLLAPGA